MRFGIDGIRHALATAMAIQEAVTGSWSEPLEDDATVVVLAVA